MPNMLTRQAAPFLPCPVAKTSPQVVQKIGLFVCLWDILWTSEGLIGKGDGLVNVNGE